MEADPTSFNGSNKHKSQCKKIKLNSPVLIIGDITFFYLSCVPLGKGASAQPFRQTGEQRFVRAANASPFMKTTSKLPVFVLLSILHESCSESIFVTLKNPAKWDCDCGELPHQSPQHLSPPWGTTSPQRCCSHWTEKKGSTQPVNLD